MPNVRSQSLDANGLSVTASDGRSITLTKAQVLANFQTQTGTLAQRIAATVLWVKQQIEAALGQEQVPAFFTHEVRDAQGNVISTTTSPGTDFGFDSVQGLRSLGFHSG